MAGITVTVQRCKKASYCHTVVMRHNGKRIREKYVKTKGEAESLADRWVIETGNSGARTAAAITDADKRWIVDAREKLAAYGKTPADAVFHYIAHLERCQISITISELADKVLTEKRRENKSAPYLKDLRLRFSSFCKEFGTRLAAEISGEEISTWLSKLEVSPATVANHRRNLNVLFNHAIRLRACERNPVTDTMRPKSVEKEIGILTVAQSSALLRAAQKSPEILPCIALGLFAGVRDAELKRLDWQDVNFESGFVEIKASKSKSARRRLIEMKPALRSWLEPLRQPVGRIWPVQTERGRGLHEEARRHAGFGTAGSETKAERDNGLKLISWPHNALRHSFASYHLAKFQNASALALEMGHANSSLIFAHYRELVLPKTAEAYWSLSLDHVSLSRE